MSRLLKRVYTLGVVGKLSDKQNLKRTVTQRFPFPEPGIQPLLINKFLLGHPHAYRCLHIIILAILVQAAAVTLAYKTAPLVRVLRPEARHLACHAEHALLGYALPEHLPEVFCHIL